MSDDVIDDDCEILPIEEIRRRYDSEWVLLDRVEVTPGPVLHSGRVLWHTKDKEELHHKALEFRPKHGALLFMGAMSRDVEYAPSIGIPMSEQFE